MTDLGLCTWRRVLPARPPAPPPTYKFEPSPCLPAMSATFKQPLIFNLGGLKTTSKQIKEDAGAVHTQLDECSPPYVPTANRLIASPQAGSIVLCIPFHSLRYLASCRRPGPEQRDFCLLQNSYWSNGQKIATCLWKGTTRTKHRKPVSWRSNEDRPKLWVLTPVNTGWFFCTCDDFDESTLIKL